MIHILLLAICVLSVEVFIRLHFFAILDAISRIFRRVFYVISKNSISDHWKEKVIPVYALKIMKYSLQILLILSLILSFFMVTGFLYHDFYALTFSLIGILESTIYAFGFFHMRKIFIR